MKLNFLLLLCSTFLLFQSCKSDNIDSNDLGAVIEGNFRGILKMEGDTISENFQVELVRLSQTSVMLNSSECNAIEVTLEGDGNLAILGNADTLDSFGYIVDDESLSFLVNNSDVFKVFEGIKE